jgi:structural maintenance of chromosomes protein 5
MPTTIEELEAAIQYTTSQANLMLFVNPHILQQYEVRQRQVLFIVVFFVGYFHVPSIFTVTIQIEDLAKKLDTDKKGATKCRAELETIKV